MTDARITQTAALVLYEPVVDARITQAAALVLYAPQPPARVTQAMAHVLAQFDADIRVTQSPVLVLADQIPCVTHWAQTWTMTRTDGQVFAFTSHDRPITYRGVVHQPCDSLMASATELSTTPGSTGNMELSGTISDDSISEADLFSGLFDGARVEIWLVPWQNSGGETPIRLLEGTIGDTEHGVLGFSAEIITPGATAQQQPLLESYTPQCRWKLGDSRCGVDLAALEVTGTVTGTAIPNAPNSATRRIFSDSSRVEASGFFELGEVTFTSGVNNGLTSEVKSFDGSTFTLWKPLLGPISIGDTYTARPGCDKSPDTCKNKFNIFINFGGFPDVPGQDAVIKTPSAR